MKKNVLYFLTLCLYLLAACTLLSRKIEGEMATQVLIQEHSVDNRYSAGGSMTADALFYVEGEPMLFEVQEGNGWESGSRLRLLPSDKWEWMPAKRPYLRFAGGRVYHFVETASRTPVEDGLAKAIDSFETGTDTYLLLCPEGLPEGWTPPETWQILQENETALLLAVSEVELPFFQHRAKFRAKLSQEEGIQILSLGEAADFLEQLPGVALTAAVLLLPLILWLLSAGMAANPGKYRVSLVLNGMLAAAALAALPWLLGRFSFPASMLPPESVLDVTWYRSRFAGIFAAMEAFGDTALYDRWLELRGQMLEVLMLSAAAGVSIVLLQWLATAVLGSIRSWRSRRYRGKYLKEKKKRK